MCTLSIWLNFEIHFINKASLPAESSLRLSYGQNDINMILTYVHIYMCNISGSEMNMYLAKTVLFWCYVFIERMNSKIIQIRTLVLWVVLSVFYD